MKKILLLGATGLLGSSLSPYLKKCGYQVIDHGLQSKATINADLSHHIASFKVFTNIQPDVIINLAGLTSVDLCQERVDLAYLANIRIVENISNWIILTKSDSHFIQISTDHLYDGPIGMGGNKEDNIIIVNNYALTKYAAELVAIRSPVTVLRTNFIGRSLIPSRETLTDWVYNNLKFGREIKVLNDVYFSPLSIRRLIQIIELVIKKKPIGVFNLGSSNGMTKADFDFAFAEALKLPTKTMKPIASADATFLRAARPKNMCLNNGKIEKALEIKLPNLIDLVQEVSEEYNEIT